MDNDTRAAIDALRSELDEMHENDISRPLAGEVDALWQALDMLGQKLLPLLDGQTAVSIILALENLEIEWKHKRLPVNSSIFRVMRQWRDDLEVVAGVGDLLSGENDLQEDLAHSRRQGFYDVVSHDKQLIDDASASRVAQPQSEPAHPEQSDESIFPNDPS